MKYEIDLDGFTEEIFYKLEELSDYGQGHKCAINANSPIEAARTLSKKLVPFFEENFKNVE